MEGVYGHGRGWNWMSFKVLFKPNNSITIKNVFVFSGPDPSGTDGHKISLTHKWSVVSRDRISRVPGCIFKAVPSYLNNAEAFPKRDIFNYWGSCGIKK